MSEHATDETGQCPSWCRACIEERRAREAAAAVSSEDGVEGIVRALMKDLDDRAGFSLDGLDAEVKEEWRRQWVELVTGRMAGLPGRRVRRAGPHLSPEVVSEARDVFPLLRCLDWEHLPEHLQAVSRPFGALALEVAVRHIREWGSADMMMDEPGPLNEKHRLSYMETATAIRKLREAKDCAVTAVAAAS